MFEITYSSSSCLYFVFICITVCSSIVNSSYLLFEFALLLTVDLNKEHSADLNHGRPVPMTARQRSPVQVHQYRQSIIITMSFFVFISPRRWAGAGLMLARRLRCRAGIGPALVQRLVFICITVKTCSLIVNFSYHYYVLYWKVFFTH